MKSVGLLKAASLAAFCGIVWSAGAQTAPKPAYLDPGLPAEQRAADLVHRIDAQ